MITSYFSSVAVLAAVTFGQMAMADRVQPPVRSKPVVSDITNASSHFRIVDINHDGTKEIIVSACDDAAGQNLVSIYRSNLMHQLTAVGSYRVSCPSDFEVQDFNGDGWLDVVVAAWDGQGPLNPSVLYGRSDGLFNNPIRPDGLQMVRNWTGYINVVDVDEVPQTDLGMIYTYQVGMKTHWGVALFEGKHFTLAHDFRGGSEDLGLPVGGIDVNGDGWRDIVFREKTLLWNGTEWVKRINQNLGIPVLTLRSRVIDYDSDGVLDFLIPHAEASSLTLCMNHTDNICVERHLVPTSLTSTPRRMAIKDLNNDAHKDFVTWSGEGLSFSISKGNWEFDLASIKKPLTGVRGIIAADLNNDNKNDVVILYNTKIAIYPGR